jgi:hypothetical protein
MCFIKQSKLYLLSFSPEMPEHHEDHKGIKKENHVDFETANL